MGMPSPPDPSQTDSAGPRFPPLSSVSSPASCNHEEDDRFGPANWVLFALAVGLMAVGYMLLALAGREAAGPFGRLAPFLIVGGLIVFSLGFVPRKKDNPLPPKGRRK